MLVLVGPSASGKSAIVKCLESKYGIKKFITCTTRPMRVGEVDKVDYYFMTKEEFNVHYGVSANTDYRNITPNGLILEFLDYFRSLKFNQKLYIIIDEYDNFTNSILEGEGEKFKGIVGNGGFLKAFYSEIKEYSGKGIVDRVFITGICPITLDSMTTGFNQTINSPGATIYCGV